MPNHTPDDGTSELVQRIRNDPERYRKAMSLLGDEDPGLYNYIAPPKTDRQTNLPQKEELTAQLQSAMVSAETCTQPLHYAVLDIDGFKSTNDNYGHDVGDLVIRYISDSLHSVVRTRTRDRRRKRRNQKDRRQHLQDSGYGVQSDLQIGRTGGGDEFGIIMYGFESDTAVDIVRRLINFVERSPVRCRTEKGLLEIPVSISYGIAEWKNGVTAGELEKQADSALYAAKNQKEERQII